MLRKLQLSLFVAAAVVASVGSVGTVSAETQNTLRFGIEAAYPPFESKSATGQLQGFDVGNAVRAKMAVKCEWGENAFTASCKASTWTSAMRCARRWR